MEATSLLVIASCDSKIQEADAVRRRALCGDSQRTEARGRAIAEILEPL